MRLLTTFSFFIIWTLYFLLGECRPYGLLEPRTQHTKGQTITIEVKSKAILGVPAGKNKKYECEVIGQGSDEVACALVYKGQPAIAKTSKAVEAGRATMDQGIPFDEEVAALKDVGLLIKVLNAIDGTKWIVMKNVQRGPPPMVNPLDLINAARTKEECLAIVKALIDRSAEMIEFWVEMKGLRHEDPKPNNVFVTHNLDRLTLIDYGRSRRFPGLGGANPVTQDADLMSKIRSDSVNGFISLTDMCNEKPSAPGGGETTFPPLIKPSATKLSDKEKARAAEAQNSRIIAEITAAQGGGGDDETTAETSQQGADGNT
ncbi:hypothetical protein EDD18DRAFT_1103007 [Armillaria luteobubalina]|uniref:Protein kinase domain-containing protein n=1 Tax=Armillaria luteobubalina TaxID=153913 RepID=A0AA39QB87_9AGAR|nr:hypothetical protein EDD18DRAFT_1103007 [Armillaria luteobubalina]